MKHIHYCDRCEQKFICLCEHADIITDRCGNCSLDVAFGLGEKKSMSKTEVKMLNMGYHKVRVIKENDSVTVDIDFLGKVNTHVFSRQDFESFAEWLKNIKDELFQNNSV